MISFIIKGLLRDRSRSLFPIITISSGVFLTVVFYSWMAGMFNEMIDISARFDAGHVKITTNGYKELAEQLPNDLAVSGVTKLVKKFETEYPSMTWAPRIKFGGLIDIPDKNGETRVQMPMYAMAVNLLGKDTPEVGLLSLNKCVVAGVLPKKHNELLLSEILAKKLGVRVGDKATLISSTIYGSMAMQNFTVTGLVRFGSDVLDRRAVITDIADAQYMLEMEDSAGEILGFTKDMNYVEPVLAVMKEKFNVDNYKKTDQYSLTMRLLAEQSQFGIMISFSKIVGYVLAAAFIFAMVLILWNAGLMNSIRRYGEIGVRLAMGEPKGVIYRSLILESVFIGIAGSVVGTVFGLAVSFYLQIYGWDFTGKMQSSTILLQNVLRAQVTPMSYVIGFIPGVIASVLGTIAAGFGIYGRQTAQLFKELEV
ncbi:MAG: FtsX-like permease family protein [Elusimicrobiota bacterium]